MCKQTGFSGINLFKHRFVSYHFNGVSRTTKYDNENEN